MEDNSEQSEYAKQQRWRTDLKEFARCSKNHWRNIIGGSFIAAVITVAASIGFSLPKIIAGVVAICFGLVCATFQAWRDKVRELEKTKQLDNLELEKAKSGHGLETQVN